MSDYDMIPTPTIRERELIWLSIVSISYLADEEGSFLYGKIEKILAIRMASFLLKDNPLRFGSLSDIIKAFSLDEELKRIRSGRYRDKTGRNLLKDITEEHGKQIVVILFTSFAHKLDIKQSAIKMIVEVFCTGGETCNVMSELSLITLRLFSAKLGLHPLEPNEIIRIKQEGTSFENIDDTELIFQAIQKHREACYQSSIAERIDYDEIQKRSNEVLRVVSKIKYHVEGAQRNLPIWRTWATRIYVLFALILSILVGALNFGDRDNFFGRITDCMTTATILLISVFGLVKLTSEDQNAIRNSFLGIKVLKTIEDVARECKCHNIEDLKIFLSMYEKSIPWASEQQGGYLKTKPTGLMVVPGGLPVGMRDVSFAHTFGNRFITRESPDGMLIIHNNYGTAQTERMDMKLPFVGVFKSKIRKVA